ncbi:hypothetical protein, partial [Klebsiella pneumoniae]
IERGELADTTLAMLAQQAGITERTLRRQFEQHLGASPKQVEQTRRLVESDEVALVALEEVRKSQGKYAEVVELLLGRADKARPGEARARIMAEIG